MYMGMNSCVRLNSGIYLTMPGSPNNNWTWMAWFKFNHFAAKQACFGLLGGQHTDCLVNTDRRNGSCSDGPGPNGSQYAPSNAWGHFTFTQNSGSGLTESYINGVLSFSSTGMGNPSGSMRVGLGHCGEPLYGQVSAIKAWSRTLTVAEIQAEMPSALPVNTTNIFSYHPMPMNQDVTTTLADYSGNSKTFTLTGTPTVDAGPPDLIWEGGHQRHEVVPNHPAGNVIDTSGGRPFTISV